MQSSPNRLTWATMVFAFIGSVVMYGVLAYILAQSGAHTTSDLLEPLRLPVTLIGIACLVVSVVWAQLRLSVQREFVPRGFPAIAGALPEPRQFITHTIIALAFAEACAILGLLFFFVGGSLTDFLLCAVPSVAVMLIVILPKGGAYWQAWESRQEE
ncbi:MAG: hypothetical protein C4335_00955 [Armatimonadota bacterium]